MKLRFHIDESGTHKESTHLVMGGVISTFQKWNTFDGKWNRALARYNAGEPIHAKELKKRDHNKELVDALFAATRGRVAFGLTVSLERDHFRNVYKSEPIPKGVQLDSEYGLLFGCWIETARDSAKLLMPDTRWSGAWVVLEQSPHFRKAAAAYAQLEADQGSEEGLPFRGLIPGNKKMPGIQLSDMMSHMGWQREGRYEPTAAEDSLNGTLEPKHLASRSENEPFPVFRAQLNQKFLQGLRDRIVAAHRK